MRHAGRTQKVHGDARLPHTARSPDGARVTLRPGRTVRGRTGRLVAGCLAMLGVLLCGGGARAQSVTGRTPAMEVPVHGAAGRLSFTAGGGVMTCGDLFRVSTRDGVSRSWITPAGEGPFSSDDFVVTLDNDVLVAGSLAYVLGRGWTGRLDGSWSRVDATAEARVAQSVQLFLYDRLSFLAAGLELERSLLSLASHPYLLGGIAVVHVSAAHADGLNQTLWGGRLGVGYHQAFDPVWGARVEIRSTIVQIKTKGHTVGLPNRDLLEVSERGPQSMFEIILAVTGVFR